MRHANMVEEFNPIELIVSATNTYPKDTWWFEELTNLNNPKWESDAYVKYERENWKYSGSLDFYDDKYGLVVVDLSDDDRIGGIEFVDNIKY